MAGLGEGGSGARGGRLAGAWRVRVWRSASDEGVAALTKRARLARARAAARQEAEVVARRAPVEPPSFGDYLRMGS